MRIYILVIFYFWHPLQSLSQESDSGYKEMCTGITQILNQVSQKLGVKFQLLKGYSNDIKLFREHYRDSILHLANDSTSYLKLEKFVEDDSVGKLIFEWGCIEGIEVISRREFEQGLIREVNNTRHKKKKRRSFRPKVGISSLLLFNGNSNCLIGIDYYSSASSGSYSYLLFKREYGKWNFCCVVFELLK